MMRMMLPAAKTSSWEPGSQVRTLVNSPAHRTGVQPTELHFVYEQHEKDGGHVRIHE